MAEVIYPGETIAADVRWRNNGGSSVTGRFRLDLRKSGLATWNEGQWKSATFPAGYTGTTTPVCQVPSDWGAGTTIDVKVMEESLGEIFRADDIFEIPEVAAIEIISVTPYVLED